MGLMDVLGDVKEPWRWYMAQHHAGKATMRPSHCKWTTVLFSIQHTPKQETH